MIVEQFGFAMIPLCFAMSSGLISGMTRGTAGSIRKALELSTTTAPALTADGANSRLLSPPAEKRAMSIPAKESWQSSETGYDLPLKEIFFPAERLAANRRNSPMGNFL